MKLNYIALLLLSFLLLTSCADEYEGFTPAEETEIDPILPGADPIIENAFDPNFVANFGQETTGNFLAEITDINGNPLEGVTVNINNSSTTTDENGIAVLQNAQVFENFAYVTATKNGFVNASRALVPTMGTNKIKIQMLPLVTSGVISSGEIARISNDSGASVELDGNYINDSGGVYEGSVSVVLNYLDAADPDMPEQMPGMLLGQDYNNNARAMITLGMLSVELRGENGEELNIAPGSTAALSFPVDPSLLAAAPATIPLWYFDETNGIWIEEGEATLIDGVYIGAVSHFSFWNCDIPTDAEIICINLEDENGAPIANQQIYVTSDDFGTTTGFTDSMGQVCGYLPINELLVLSIFTDDCGDIPAFSTEIGPFTVPETITVVADFGNNTTVFSETVTGVFNDCDGNPVTNGYVIFNYNETLNYTQVTNGNFTISAIRCTPNLDFTLQGVDLDNFDTTDVEAYAFTTPTTDIGILTSCVNITEFFSFTIDNDDPVVFIDNLDYSSNNPPGFSMSANNPDGGIDLSMPEMTPGIYSNTDPGVFLYLYDTMGNIIKGDLIGITNINFEIVNFGAVGEFIDITFSGTFNNQGGDEKNIVGELHMIRPN